MQDYIKERSDRLFNFSNKFSKIDSLLGKCELPKNIFSDLRTAAQVCLYDSLSSYYPNKLFNLDLTLESFCLFYRNDIIGLPNITPNGLLMPKIETNSSHNLFNKKVYNLIEYLSFSEGSKVACPINLRINFGTNTNPEFTNRPRSSTNWHTDIWAGQNCNEAMIHTPICGDYEQSGISVSNPQEGFYPDYVKSIPSFLEGEPVTNEMSKNKIEFTMKLGESYLLDSFLFHKTSLSSSTIRIIVSFPARLKEKVSSDIYENPLRDDEFIDIFSWSKLGKKLLLASDKSLSKQIWDDTPKDYYAGKFNFIDLDEFFNIT